MQTPENKKNEEQKKIYVAIYLIKSDVFRCHQKWKGADSELFLLVYYAKECLLFSGVWAKDIKGDVVDVVLI